MIAKSQQLVRYASAGATVLGLSISFQIATVAGQTRTADPFRWEGTLGSGVLEIKGVNGSIQAQPATGTTAVVEATRTGRRNDPADVQLVVVEHSGGVTVCAVYPSTSLRSNECLPGEEGRISANNNDVRVDFIVRVPASNDLRARTINGEVNVEGLVSDVEIRTTNGDVRVDGGATVVASTTNGSVSLRSSGYASVHSTNGSIEADLTNLNASNDDLSFSTTNGAITLRLPADTNARLDAQTTNGRIESALPVTVQGRFGRNRLEGTIGTGGRLIELRTTNGGIHLERGS